VESENLKVRCVGCDNKFELASENFSDHEIIFCPTCGLDYEVLKRKNQVVAAIA
jgi:rRNA maturation endonuclease Nob1